MIPDVCATPGCERPARWIPISEGNRGSRLYRCTQCCDRIDAGGCITPDDQPCPSVSYPEGMEPSTAFDCECNS